ncbi:MAG: hypothetical protein HKN91_00320 [Acidimicrobiia bacterium]|nr:hypothetical protein [Acidimicrobiia bacterium]
MSRPLSSRVTPGALGGTIVAAIAVLWLATQIGPGPTKCQSGEWPAFMLSSELRVGQQAPGWILWCKETHWTIHVATKLAGETQSREVRGEGEPPFPWFSPSLSPDEAWRTLTGTHEKNVRQPRNSQAVTAYTIRTELGQFRMEFSREGIPVLVRVPGDDGYRFSGHLDRAASQVGSDADFLNWPACGDPGYAPQCWTDEGGVRPGCLRFGRLTDNRENNYLAGCL